MQQCTALSKLGSPTSFSGRDSSLTSSTCTHHVTKTCEFLTVPTSSHNFFSCTTASPIFPSYFQNVKFLENHRRTLFTPAHQPWIDLPHCAHNNELAITLKLQTTHDSTLCLDKPSCLMPLLTITMDFLRQTFALESILPF